MRLFGLGKRKEDIFPKWGTVNIGCSDPLRHSLNSKNEVVWDVSLDPGKPHYDHIEMTGFRVSLITSYGVTKAGELRMYRHGVFPNFRMIPNDTHASLSHSFPESVYRQVMVNQKPLGKEYLQKVTLNGFLEILSTTNSGVLITRLLYPSHEEPAFLERITLKNVSQDSLSVEVGSPDYHVLTKKRKSLHGSHALEVTIDKEIPLTTLKPNQEIVFTLVSKAKNPALSYLDNPVYAHADMAKRKSFLQEVDSSLVLQTPSDTINGMFLMAKRRFSESIIKTKSGYMHAPGGGGYYAAIWTNDQCEYGNPLFPLTGYNVGNEQAINSYKLFMKHMAKDFSKPLVSSIIAEGDGTWNGAGDRGDAAMFAYGAGRFALSYGCEITARELWPGIEWSIEYSLRKLNNHGVVESDSDELENRFNSGKANLCTSCLLYDALISAGYLVKSLGLEGRDQLWYHQRAEQLQEAIDRYFGAEIEGFATYRYYEKNRVLRAWICMPLTVGILTRAKGTIDALFSPSMWSYKGSGVRTLSNFAVFWDRSTLFALRGAFISGDHTKGLSYLQDYSTKRLLGDHVPYPIESYPEGNQRHLAAESALYVRIITEGMFGIRPTGFGELSITPQLPESWDNAVLENIHVGEHIITIQLFKRSLGIRICVTSGDREIECVEIPQGESITIEL